MLVKAFSVRWLDMFVFQVLLKPTYIPTLIFFFLGMVLGGSCVMLKEKEEKNHLTTDDFPSII